MAYGLALAFDTNSPEFARGVEIGRLWEQLHARPEQEIDQLVHVTNAEMVLRLADACDRVVTSEEHDGTWMTVRFEATVPTETSL